MLHKKLADFLWPAGPTALALFGVPLAIEQYPEFFKENRWPLPIALAVVAACWIVPFFLRERAKNILHWVLSGGGLRRVSAAIVAVFVTIILSATLFIAAVFSATIFNAAGILGFVGARRVSAPAGYELVWSDEFNGPDGAVPDAAKWAYDIGGDGWGNHELEFYTDHAQNAQMKSGNLVITAQKETTVTPKKETRLYTSARIKTQTLFSQTYGRFEARIKIPHGEGMWPAFWMLGDDIASVGWPRCGEIDIMENIGKEPAVVHGSLHGAGAAGGTADLTSKYSLPGNPKLSDDFHLYAVEWDADTIRFFIDATNYATFKREQWPAGAAWPFDHKFFVILNLAVGGDWPGPPDRATAFPQQMLVDYVRVYSKAGAKN